MKRINICDIKKLVEKINKKEIISRISEGNYKKMYLNLGGGLGYTQIYETLADKSSTAIYNNFDGTKKQVYEYLLKKYL